MVGDEGVNPPPEPVSDESGSESEEEDLHNFRPEDETALFEEEGTPRGYEGENPTEPGFRPNPNHSHRQRLGFHGENPMAAEFSQKKKSSEHVKKDKDGRKGHKGESEESSSKKGH
jgi:hypothetical protein